MSFQFFISAEKQQQRHHGHIFKQCEWELALKKLNQKKKKTTPWMCFFFLAIVDAVVEVIHMT